MMKKNPPYFVLAFHALIIGVICLLPLGLSSTPNKEALDFPLAKQGKTEYTILIQTHSDELTQFAASELANFLKKSTSVEWAIKKEAALPNRKEIRLERIDDDPSVPEHPQGYRIFTEGNDIVIRARSPHGILYGVYAFLENKVGIRWFTPDETLVPQHETLTLPSFDITQAPAFSYREIYAADAFRDRLWAQRRRLNTGIFRWPDKLSDHLYNYLPEYSCHTFSRLVPPNKHFDNHPEYYGLLNGKRDKSLLCLSNPAVFDIALKTLQTDLTQYKERPYIVSISQNDCNGWCQCPKCQEIIKEEVCESGLLLRFLNKLDDALKGENISIHTLAYVGTSTAPSKTKPNPGIIIQFCPISICYGHPPGQCKLPGHEGNTALENKLKGWTNIHDNIWIWSYHVNFAHSLQPFPNIHTIAPYIRYFSDNHAKGVFAQSDVTRATTGLYRLRHYLLAKLLWNPKIDEQATINEFVTHYYKEAALPISEYLTLLEQSLRDHPDIHACIYDSPRAPYLSDKFVAHAEAIFSRALEATRNNPVTLFRIKGEYLAIQYLILERWLNNHTSRDVEEMSRMVDEFDAACKQHNIVGISEHDGKDEKRQEFIKLIREKIAKDLHSQRTTSSANNTSKQSSKIL